MEVALRVVVGSTETGISLGNGVTAEPVMVAAFSLEMVTSTTSVVVEFPTVV